MSNFKYVSWNGKTPVDKDRLYAMSESDQYLYDDIASRPAGILAWSENFDDESVPYNAPYHWLPDMDITITHAADRLIKVSYRQKGVKATLAASAMTSLWIDPPGASPEAMYATTVVGCVKNAPAGGAVLSYTFSPSAGSYRYRVRGTVLNAASGSIVWRASPTSPRQLVIEDLGPYVAPTA